MIRRKKEKYCMHLSVFTRKISQSKRKWLCAHMLRVRVRQAAMTSFDLA
jgi:hypothetical protein